MGGWPMEHKYKAPLYDWKSTYTLNLKHVYALLIWNTIQFAWIRMWNTDMELVLYFVLLNVLFAYGDTGSGISLQHNDLNVELKYLKEIITTMKKEINFLTAARINLDKELSDLTRRYRKLLIENNDIKRSLEEAKREVAANLSSTTMDIKHEVDELLTAWNENTTNALISKTQGDMKKDIEEIKKGEFKFV